MGSPNFGPKQQAVGSQDPTLLQGSHLRLRHLWVSKSGATRYQQLHPKGRLKVGLHEHMQQCFPLAGSSVAPLSSHRLLRRRSVRGLGATALALLSSHYDCRVVRH